MRAYWFTPGARVFVAVLDGAIAGSYILRANHLGRGNHVANAGYVVAQRLRGRGLAGTMCEHSLATARAAGFCAMQFNFVVSTNAAAVETWKRHGFAIAGVLPKAYRHKTLGDVDVYVMHRAL